MTRRPPSSCSPPTMASITRRASCGTPVAPSGRSRCAPTCPSSSAPTRTPPCTAGGSSRARPSKGSKSWPSAPRSGSSTPPHRPSGAARPVGRLALFGVPLRLDVSWVFGLGLATWTFADAVLPLEAPDRATGVYAAGGALTALLIFGSLALHEGGHWLVAHRAGLPAVRLVLSLVGGSLELGAA